MSTAMETKETAMKTAETAAVTRTTVAPAERLVTVTLKAREWERIHKLAHEGAEGAAEMCPECDETVTVGGSNDTGDMLVLIELETQLTAGGVL